MTILVTGKNGSGKSVYAEDLAKRICSGRLIYIATLIPSGGEDAARIEKHRAQRAGMGFRTVESSSVCVNVTGQDTVLLEDVSNLLANLMFTECCSTAAETTLCRLSDLRKSCGNLIAVSISGLDENDGSDEETKRYITALQRVNSSFSEQADVVVELVSGEPVIRKGCF